MTWIMKAPHDETERAKWRAQANKAAAHLKGTAFGEQEQHEAAFVFDDGIVKLRMEVALIERLNEEALADWVFDAVLAKVSGVAFAEVQDPSTFDVKDQAPEPEVPCMRRLEPDFKEPCPNKAAGGLKITLRPGEAVQKRWGLASLITFVMDLTVCQSCLPKVQIMEITDPELRAKLGKAAQQMNNGVLVDWKRTLIEHVPFNDPQYKALRAEMDRKTAAAAPAANEAEVQP